MKYRYHGRDDWSPLPLPSGAVWLSPNDTLELTDDDLEWLKRHDLNMDFRLLFRGFPDYGTRLSNAPEVEFPESKPKRKRTPRKTKMSRRKSS